MNFCVFKQINVSKIISVSSVFIFITFGFTITGRSKTIDYPWTISASLGYADYQYVHRGDHITAAGRFAIGRDLLIKGPALFGLEIGLQSGNQMRLQMTEEEIDALGGLLVKTTLKPMVDALATMRITPKLTAPLFLQLKAGGAYRQWQMDRDTINDISQLAGEIMAGCGYTITPNASITLSYQGIFGAKPDFTIDLESGIGHVQNIPIQHAVLLGIILMI
ncbi:hypothetical protein EP47_12725 [Legionella norrlandica]|uniref:Outer membrane protein beta-barrel domain-containing protein n=1 Tax=Legionella norrlandica TaxID=1498499 RepID=A0A0A2T4A4_9GAMM|nr:hypothetical protein [Legionella norrlandica]KGP62253.1 hypothetical protein EP47_12725 [Legionella norrlandica]